MRDKAEAKEITQMYKSAIKSKAKMEAEGIEIMRARSEAMENVQAEVKRNGKGDMKTLGISAAESIERARSRAEAKMRG